MAMSTRRLATRLILEGAADNLTKSLAQLDALGLWHVRGALSDRDEQNVSDVVHRLREERRFLRRLRRQLR